MEHMLYVSCKFTRTVEMIRKIIENIVLGYEYFFHIAYKLLVSDEEKMIGDALGVPHKINALNKVLAERGIFVDLSDYFMLKRILHSDYEKVGEFRKNLCMISYIDGEKYYINIDKLFDYYENLKSACAFMENFNIDN